MASNLDQLPPDLELRVKACMAAGAYQSQAEVLRDALDALEEREQTKLELWQQRNQKAIEQSRAGLSKPLNLSEVLNQVEKRVVPEDQSE